MHQKIVYQSVFENSFLQLHAPQTVTHILQKAISKHAPGEWKEKILHFTVCVLTYKNEEEIVMEKAQIDQVVDAAFVTALAKVHRPIALELYPAAFSDDNSWQHVKNAIALNNSATRDALKVILSELL